MEDKLLGLLPAEKSKGGDADQRIDPKIPLQLPGPPIAKCEHGQKDQETIQRKAALPGLFPSAAKTPPCCLALGRGGIDEPGEKKAEGTEHKKRAIGTQKRGGKPPFLLL